MTDSTYDFSCIVIIVSELVASPKQGWVEEIIYCSTLDEARAKQARIADQRGGNARKILICNQVSIAASRA